MKLDNFDLEEYSQYNPLHQEVLSQVDSQLRSKLFLGDVNLIAQRTDERYQENFKDRFYIAFYNDEPIGFITLNLMGDKYEISSGIIPAFQKQHLGPLLLQEFSEAIFNKYYDIDKLYLHINEKNIAGQKSAELAGYEHEAGNRYSMRR